jgi:DNA-binding response OmpR family regulator
MATTDVAGTADAGPDRVLVVDDDEHSARIAARLLSARGYDVRTAHDGGGALAEVTTHRPHCILLDIMMPRMSGLEVLAQLKESAATASIPVILVTAKSQDEDVLTGYRQGAEYYITKPFSAQELLYGIRLVLGKQPAAGRASTP